MPGNRIAESVKSRNLKSEFKGQIVSKFDLGLLNAYNPMYFDRNISENKDGKKIEGSYWSCVTYSEFHYLRTKVNQEVAHFLE